MKPETEIRNLKRDIKERHRTYLDAMEERNLYRARVTKAEQEAAEWKRRFDELLSKCRGFDGAEVIGR